MELKKHFAQCVKNPGIVITTNLLRKVFKYWDAIQLLLVDTSLLKNLIFSWKFEFYHWQQIMSMVYLKHLRQFTLCIFSNVSTTYTEWDNYSLSFFQVKIRFSGEKQLAQPSVENTNRVWLFLGHRMLFCSRSSSWLLPISSDKIKKLNVHSRIRI